MAKTQEELTQLKNECETLNNKLKELTEEELAMVVGGLKIGEEPKSFETTEQLEGFCPFGSRYCLTDVRCSGCEHQKYQKWRQNDDSGVVDGYNKMYYCDLGYGYDDVGKH